MIIGPAVSPTLIGRRDSFERATYDRVSGGDGNAPVPQVVREILVERDLAQAIDSFAATHGSSERAVVAAGLAAVLARYGGEGTLRLALHPPAAPSRIGVAYQPPSRALIAVRGSESFVDLLRHIDAGVADAGGDVDADSDGATDAVTGALPGFRDVLVLWSETDASRAEQVASVAELSAARDVTFAWDRRGDARVLIVAYSPWVYGDAMIERMAAHIGTALRVGVHAPEATLASIRLAAEGERLVHASWNATGATWSGPLDVASLAADALAAHAQHPALAFGGQTLTYAEVEARTAKLARYLRARGVGRETLVGIFVERSPDMIVSVLAVQRAGGSYLPIDPAYPRDRIAYMLGDSGAPLVVTQHALRDKLPADGAAALVSLDDDADEIARATPLRAQPLDPSQRAYLIYTSGSTGKPKGVEVEHRNVVNFLNGMQSAVRLGVGDTLIALAPLAFDISTLDMFLPLLGGARTIIAPRETATSPKALMALMEASGVTHMQATPSTWRMLVDAGWRGRAGLVALCGGEALPAPLARELLARGLTVWNLYGPTEATVWATMTPITDATPPITIGRPMPNVQTWILDDSGDLAPIGVLGELCIGGGGVARGYLGRPELTAERFVEHHDPLTGERTRIYRTGDLARYDQSGNIEFVGRVDSQVKLRGYRIELGEVEAALAALAGVRAAAAVVREDRPGDPHLAAYVTLDEGTSVSPAALRRALLDVLPAYMVPDSIGVLHALPLSSNGKIDRRALGTLPPAAAGGEHVAPRTTLEARITRIWEEVLGIAPIGVTDDFFALGATSLGAGRVFERIERELGASLPLSPIFQAPTIERLAALVEHAPRRQWETLVPMQTAGTRTPIFCVHGGGGTIVHFQLLARRLGNDQPFYGFQLRGLYGDVAPLGSVAEMAAHNITEMKSVQPEGPYVLAGYCFGILVAFEMAQQLTRAGERVALVVGINGGTPDYIRRHGRPRHITWVDAVERPTSRVGRAVLAVKRVKWALEPANLAPIRRARGVARRTKLRSIRLLARLHAAAGRPLPERIRGEGVYEVCHWAEEHYRAAPFDGRMLLFTAPELFRERDIGWGALVRGELMIEELPGHHETQRNAMYEPAVALVARRIEAELERVLGAPAPR